MRYRYLGIIVGIMLLFTISSIQARTIEDKATIINGHGPAVPYDEVSKPDMDSADSTNSEEVDDIIYLNDPGEPYCPILPPPEYRIFDDDGEGYQKPPIP